MNHPRQTSRKLRARQVAKLLDCGQSTVWHYAKADPDFPKPFKLGPRLTVWDEAELEAYAEAQKAKARALR